MRYQPGRWDGLRLSGFKGRLMAWEGPRLVLEAAETVPKDKL